MQTWSRWPAEFQIEQQNGEGDSKEFERGMAIGARKADLNVSESADQVGFSNTAISRVYRKRPEKEKLEQQFSGWICLIDARGVWPNCLKLMARQQ